MGVERGCTDFYLGFVCTCNFPEYPPFLQVRSSDFIGKYATNLHFLCCVPIQQKMALLRLNMLDLQRAIEFSMQRCRRC